MAPHKKLKVNNSFFKEIFVTKGAFLIEDKWYMTAPFYDKYLTFFSFFLEKYGKDNEWLVETNQEDCFVVDFKSDSEWKAAVLLNRRNRVEISNVTKESSFEEVNVPSCKLLYFVLEFFSEGSVSYTYYLTSRYKREYETTYLPEHVHPIAKILNLNGYVFSDYFAEKKFRASSTSYIVNGLDFSDIVCDLIWKNHRNCIYMEEPNLVSSDAYRNKILDNASGFAIRYKKLTSFFSREDVDKLLKILSENPLEDFLLELANMYLVGQEKIRRVELLKNNSPYMPNYGERHLELEELIDNELTASEKKAIEDKKNRIFFRKSHFSILSVDNSLYPLDFAYRSSGYHGGTIVDSAYVKILKKWLSNNYILGDNHDCGFSFIDQKDLKIEMPSIPNY